MHLQSLKVITNTFFNKNLHLRSLFLHTSIFIFLFTGTASGQFLNLQIEVEPEVDTTVEQSLSFGQVTSGAGQVRIQLGDPNMGVFRISAIRAQRLLISLEHSIELTSRAGANPASIPFDIEASYTYFGVNDYRESVPLTSDIENIVIEAPPTAPNATWSSAFIYVYGTLDIGNVPNDVYVGEVQLTIVYE